eukprot:6965119-Prymnesium_polylepis.1
MSMRWHRGPTGPALDARAAGAVCRQTCSTSAYQSRHPPSRSKPQGPFSCREAEGLAPRAVALGPACRQHRAQFGHPRREGIVRRTTPIPHKEVAHPLEPSPLAPELLAIELGDRLGEPAFGERGRIDAYRDALPVDGLAVRQRVDQADVGGHRHARGAALHAAVARVPRPRLACRVARRRVPQQKRHAAARDRVKEPMLVRQVALDDRAQQRLGHECVRLLGRERERPVVDDRVQADPQLRVRHVQPPQLRAKVLPDPVDALVEHGKQEDARRVAQVGERLAEARV